jgi:Tfp pilus assembly protein PilV
MKTAQTDNGAASRRGGVEAGGGPGGGCGRSQAFSLIEVVLALAVIAFGVVSVLALLPASMKSSRDSVADTHSALVGEHLIEMLSTAMENAPDATTWYANALTLPTAKPGAAESATTWVNWRSQDGIRYWRVGTSNQLHRVELRREGNDYAEFAGMVRVWRQPVAISQFASGAWTSRTLPWTEAVALNLEVSWPVQAPYARRQKALYALNVFWKAP